MSLFELRHYIEMQVPWWSPVVMIGACGVFCIILEILKK